MSTITTISVTGLTCGHCVNSVVEEVSEIDGVQQVEVDLVTGGESAVTITSEQEIDPGALKAAITEAGYILTSGPGQPLP